MCPLWKAPPICAGTKATHHPRGVNICPPGDAQFLSFQDDAPSEKMRLLVRIHIPASWS